jgi:hypothetical protein
MAFAVAVAGGQWLDLAGKGVVASDASGCAGASTVAEPDITHGGLDEPVDPPWQVA